MTKLAIVNNQGEDSPVSPNDLTNWNGEDVTALELPVFNGHVGDEIVDEVDSLIDEFVFLTPQQRTLMTTWIGQANVFHWFGFTPRLGVTAGNSECGKSQALQACRLLTNQSLWIGDATGASFFTQTQHGDKAVFLDEMQDMLIGKDKTLLSALKTGCQPNGSVTRIDLGSNGRSVRCFRTWSAVGFNGIGVDRFVDSQIHSRTHWLYMRRAFTDEQRELLDERVHGEKFTDVGSRYLKWLHQNEQKIKAFRNSDLPPFIVNRGRDKWKPLFAIASVVGGKWVKHLTDIADDETALSNELTDGTQVLLAIQTINEDWEQYSPNEPRDSKIAPHKLAKLLTKWADESGLKPYARFHQAHDPEDRHITKQDLFKLLRPYVRPKNNRSRFDTNDRSSGYEWAELLDVADRHLPEEYRICQVEAPDKGVSHD